MSAANEFDDEDDAAELKFTSEIKDCETLLISEVYLILQKRRQEMDEQERLLDFEIRSGSAWQPLSRIG
ncbi:DNA-directed RNA polymerase II subunit [Trichinella spiralis]|uniref:DNA-directed RNA polymerase II subunit n=1 Tax=Trichinella spiralis TaxID=6334 RepID=A0ABR3KHA7_TRISP